MHRIRLAALLLAWLLLLPAAGWAQEPRENPTGRPAANEEKPADDSAVPS